MSFVVATAPIPHKVTVNHGNTAKVHSFIDTIAARLDVIQPGVSEDVVGRVAKLLGSLSIDDTVNTVIKHHDYTYLAGAAWLLVESSLYRDYQQLYAQETSYRQPVPQEVKQQAIQVMTELHGQLLPQVLGGIANSLTKDVNATVRDSVTLTMFQELCYLLSIMQSATHP